MHEENDVAENSAAEGVLCWTSVSGVVNALDKFCFLSQFAYQASCACHLLVPVPVWVTSCSSPQIRPSAMFQLEINF